MTKNINFVSHKKSKLKTNDGKPQLPSASALVEGEIAINYAEDVETLSIKNESGDVVTFSSDNYYTEKKLGSGFTGENSGVTVTEAIENSEEVSISSGVTPSGTGIEIWIDESVDPADADVYTKAQTDSLLNLKLDTSAYTEYWTSGTGENAVVLKNSSGTASGDFSVAEGYYTEASGDYSHAEGDSTTASSESSHAEGSGTEANGDYSHAEGASTIASGQYSHAEGYYTEANGSYSHAEGTGTTASGDSSHAEGDWTEANGYSSHAEGHRTTANNNSEHASGMYNISRTGSTDDAKTLFTVGNGTAEDARHNAFEIRQNGDIYIVSGNTDIKLQDNLGVDLSNYYTKSETSGATELTTAFAAKANTTDLADFFDDAKYEDSGSTKVINFYHGNTIKATIDASDFIVDGMVESVSAGTSGSTTVLDIKWNTAARSKETILDIGDMFEADNYYTKSETSGATELTTAFAAKANTATTLAGYGITDAYTKSETSGATEISNALSGKVNSATFTGHTADTSIHFTTGAVQTQIDNSISGKVNTSDIVTAITSSNSGSTNPIATKVVAENELVVSTALNDLNQNKADKSTTYTKTEIDDMIGDIETLLAAI